MADSFEEKKIVTPQNESPIEDLIGHSLKPSNSYDRVSEIERLANIFTQSPGYFTTNNNDNNQVLTKHNGLDNYKNNRNITNLITPDMKIKRHLRVGEYSPLNPAYQVNSQPFFGLGEYDNKRKQILEKQKKEFIEYLSKAKQVTSNLPRLTAYSSKETFKTAMEDNNLKHNKLGKKVYNQDIIQSALFTDGVELCPKKIKETNRLKQEHYRLELNKQIEEKKRLELEQKHKEKMEDEAIEKILREQEKKNSSKKKETC